MGFSGFGSDEEQSPPQLMPLRPLSIEAGDITPGGLPPRDLGVGSNKVTTWTLDQLAAEIKVKKSIVDAVSKSLDEDGDPVLVADFGSMRE